MKIAEQGLWAAKISANQAEIPRKDIQGLKEHREAGNYLN